MKKDFLANRPDTARDRFQGETKVATPKLKNEGKQKRAGVIEQIRMKNKRFPQGLKTENMSTTLVATKSEPKYTRCPNTTRELSQENRPDLAKPRRKNRIAIFLLNLNKNLYNHGGHRPPSLI
jgi:hypothetical protein